MKLNNFGPPLNLTRGLTGNLGSLYRGGFRVTSKAKIYTKEISLDIYYLPPAAGRFRRIEIRRLLKILRLSKFLRSQAPDYT